MHGREPSRYLLVGAILEAIVVRGIARLLLGRLEKRVHAVAEKVELVVKPWSGTVRVREPLVLGEQHLVALERGVAGLSGVDETRLAIAPDYVCAQRDEGLPRLVRELPVNVTVLGVEVVRALDGDCAVVVRARGAAPRAVLLLDVEHYVSDLADDVVRRRRAVGRVAQVGRDVTRVRVPNDVVHRDGVYRVVAQATLLRRVDELARELAVRVCHGAPLLAVYIRPVRAERPDLNLVRGLVSASGPGDAAHLVAVSVGLTPVAEGDSHVTRFPEQVPSSHGTRGERDAGEPDRLETLVRVTAPHVGNGALVRAAYGGVRALPVHLRAIEVAVRDGRGRAVGVLYRLRAARAPVALAVPMYVMPRMVLGGLGYALGIRECHRPHAPNFFSLCAMPTGPSTRLCTSTRDPS